MTGDPLSSELRLLLFLLPAELRLLPKLLPPPLLLSLLLLLLRCALLPLVLLLPLSALALRVTRVLVGLSVPREMPAPRPTAPMSPREEPLLVGPSLLPPDALPEPREPRDCSNILAGNLHTMKLL